MVKLPNTFAPVPIFILPEALVIFKSPDCVVIFVAFTLLICKLSQGLEVLPKSSLVVFGIIL